MTAVPVRCVSFVTRRWSGNLSKFLDKKRAGRVVTPAPLPTRNLGDSRGCAALMQNELYSVLGKSMQTCMNVKHMRILGTDITMVWSCRG